DPPLPRPRRAARARRARGTGALRAADRAPRPAPRGCPVLLARGPRRRARRGGRRPPRARRAGAGGGRGSEPIRSKAGLAEFYDDPHVVETYLERKAQPLGSVLHARQVAYLNRVITELSPSRVLELAPGPARLSAELRQVPVAVGMDMSPRMLV